MLNDKIETSSYKIQVPELLNNSYLPVLDGFRGVAILMVIVSHLLLTTILYIYGYRLGYIGVEIFFVLSGFLITTLLLKEKQKNGWVSLKNFYIRRILRILPVAYLFLVVLLGLNYIYNLNISSGSFVASALYFRNFHLSYIGSWFNGHFWTLSIEEQFYLIFPILIIHSLKSYVRLIFLIIIAIPMLEYLVFHNIGIFYSNSIIHHISLSLLNLFIDGTPSILIGSLLSILMFNRLLSVKNVKINHFFSFLVFTIAIIFRLTCVDLVHSSYLLSTTFSIVIAYVIYLTIVNGNDFLSQLLKNKLLVNIGVLSYSLYIWQQIFLHKQPWANSFKFADSLFLNIPALFIVAYLSYHFYELKFLKLKEKFKSVGHNIDNKTL